MKIALLLFGHLRDFEQCADSLNENLLSRYDSDVFIHTWDELDHKSKTWHEQRCEASKVDDKVVEIIKSKYNPRGLQIEHQEKWPDEKMISLSAIPGLKLSTAIPHFMFYSLSKANQLRKEYESKMGITYDFVFVTRPDVRLKNIFELEKYLTQIEVLGFDLNASRFFGPYESKYFSYGYTIINTSNDLFFFAKPGVIDRYIGVNEVLTDEDVEKYGVTAVSIYTAKEIRCGIMPIPVAYMMDRDWDYGGVRPSQLQPRQTKGWKKHILKIFALVLYPIFKLQKKYRLLNYFEYKKEYK